MTPASLRVLEHAYGVGVPVYGAMPTAEELAVRVPAVPPLLTATGLIGGERVTNTPAALLVWGQHPDAGWQAGVCFVYRVFCGSPLAALLTVWVPAGQVERRRGESYERVSRVRLTGRPDRWPALSAAYPSAGPDWLARHLHVPVADPAGEYRELRAEIRALRTKPGR